MCHSQTNMTMISTQYYQRGKLPWQLKVLLRTNKGELILRDRNRLSQENALTISDYIIAMKREVNPRLNYKRNTIQILSGLSRAVGIQKKFIDMNRDDILCYRDNCRKPENEDPLHKWIGTYNTRLVILCRFFKWLHYI